MESHARDLDNYVNVARNRRRRAKALLDFERHDDDELGFRKNDIITVSSWLLLVVFFEALHLHTHTHPFNGPLSRTSRVSRYQKGKTNLDFTEARDSEWQWHQLGYMQVCTSLQTGNHANTSPLIFYGPDALPVAQPTASKH